MYERFLKSKIKFLYEGNANVIFPLLQKEKTKLRKRGEVPAHRVKDEGGKNLAFFNSYGAIQIWPSGGRLHGEFLPRLGRYEGSVVYDPRQ